MKKINTSLIISTYNWHEALDLCLKSIFAQSITPSEILVADDGSRDITRLLIQEISKNAPCPIVHVWQPDDGFKLAQIRNKAIAKSKYEYIIQIDGDLILHKYFIADHLFLAKERHFITGSRVLLSTETSQLLLKNRSIDIEDHSSKKDDNLFNGLRIKFLQEFFADRYKQSRSNKYYVKGCNMSFWREDLIDVNGYNENFLGWGREDSEIAIRLINSGIKKRFLKMGGVCHHIYHEEASREMHERNTKIMNDAIDGNLTFIEKGLNQYL